MTHKTLRASIMLLLISLLILGCQPITPTSPPSPPPTETSTVRIAPDGSGDAPTLKEAVERASEGGRIELAAGTYRLLLPLTIEKAITLVGAGIDQTTIISSAAEFVVRLSGNGPFAAQGITFRHEGEGWADVVIVSEGEIDISGCRFSGATGSLLSIEGSTTGSVRNSVMEGGSGTVGVYIQGHAQPTLEGNTCSGNGYGIRATDDAQPTLLGNVCSDNRFDGIKFDGNATGTVRGNECTGNRSGISVEGSARPILEENILTGNNQSGIAYHDSGGGSARGNTCSENFGGIGVSDEAQPALEGNTCSDNMIAGIAYFAGGGGTARQNHATANGLHGIGIFDQAEPLLEGNVLADNGNAGIAYLGITGGIARDNECTGNAIGILIETTASPTLEDNNLHDNTSADLNDLRP